LFSSTNNFPNKRDTCSLTVKQEQKH
jgi:hypothetical protein